MNVGGWLRKLSLKHYEAAFRENEINLFQDAPERLFETDARLATADYD